jgi:LmbE family N-acetylglucosaminyl deacetylase
VPFELSPAITRSKVILGLAAHPDDLEIGCGGTVHRLVNGADPVVVHWLVVQGTPSRLEEARVAAARLLGPHQAGELLVAGEFRDGFLPGAWADVKDRIRALTDGISPDLVFAPSRADLHQDHRLVGELAWQLFRGASIWEYEIAKWDGDLGQPNLYVPLTSQDLEFKLDLLHASFPSQASKDWFDDEAFRGLARLRGIEAGTRYAEGFTASKTIVGFPGQVPD